MDAHVDATRCVPPHVAFTSHVELRKTCEDLLGKYVQLTHRVVRRKLRERAPFAAAWTELDRLMFGIASFDEVMDKGVYLVLRSTKWNGALYAHDLNTRITRGINKHNSLFFHETTAVSETELLSSLSEMLGRMLLTAQHSHYNVLLDENFERCVAWDGEQWLVCPRGTLCEYEAAVRSAKAIAGLHDDVVGVILALLGIPTRSSTARGDLHPRGRESGQYLPVHGEASEALGGRDAE